MQSYQNRQSGQISLLPSLYAWITWLWDDTCGLISQPIGASSFAGTAKRTSQPFECDVQDASIWLPFH